MHDVYYMINTITADVMRAICSRLRAVDIRALMLTCRGVHTCVHPLVEARTLETPYGGSAYPEIILIDTLMYRIGVKISSAYRVNDPVIKTIPQIIPVNYTGTINILYKDLTYYMYVHAGRTTIYVGWDSTRSLERVHIEQCESVHFINAISNIPRLYLNSCTIGFHMRFINAYIRVCGSNLYALDLFARSPEFIALLRDA